MLIRLTPTEAVALAAIGGAALPPAVTSVSAAGAAIRVTADLRKLDELPGPLRLAARLAPIVRADVRVLGFTAGVATLGVEVNAAGLPVGKLLGLLAAPLEKQLVRQGLPAQAVDIRADGSVVVDVEVLLADALPGLDVTGLAVEDGEVVIRASVG